MPATSVAGYHNICRSW